MCDEKNKLSQVSAFLKGNLTADSDRVKALVVSAGPTDSGRGHSHDLVDTPEADSKSKWHQQTSIKSPDASTPNPFRRSSIINRSPKGSSSISEIHFTPRTERDDTHSKRKREDEDSYTKHSAKTACVENTITKLDRTVTKLCKSASESSNTKKEIRDLCAILRNLMTRLISEQDEIVVTTEASKQNEACQKTMETKETQTLTVEVETQTQQSSIINNIPQTTVEAEVTKIHETLKNDTNEEKLVQTMVTNWPKGTYTNTTKEQKDILTVVSKENTIVIIEAMMETAEKDENPMQMPIQIQSMLKKRKVRSGEIIHVKSSETVIVEDNSVQQDSEVNTYIVPISVHEDKTKTTAETLKTLKKLQKSVLGKKSGETEECSYTVGTTSKNLEIPVRKVLELIGHREDVTFSLYTQIQIKNGSSRTSKSNIHPQEVRNEIPTMETKNKQIKWEPARKRRPKVETLVITPKENTSYADMLKTLKSEIDIKKMGVQVRRVQSKESGDIQIEFTSGSKDNVDSFQKEVVSKIGDTATAKLTEKTGKVVIRDLDVDVSEDEIKKAINDAIGKNITMDVQMPTVHNSRGHLLAFITLPINEIKTLLQQTRIHIGWSRCRIEEKITLQRCYKCLGFGHMAAKCIKKEDKGNHCFKCGESNHKVKECSNNLMCLECNVPGHRMDSMACPTYAKLINDIRNNRRGDLKGATKNYQI